MFTSATVKTKQSKPQLLKAEHRKYAIICEAALLKREAVGLFLDPGLGKTRIFLSAFNKLKKKKVVRRALVVAKARIIHNTWPAEIKKWGFPLSHEIIKGRANVEAVLFGDADIVLVSYESLPLVVSYLDQLYTTPHRLDWICFDESTKIKNPNSKRFKAIRYKLKLFSRRTIMTGTPTPQSYLDLWSQLFVLDFGVALESRVGRYRLNYFVPCGYMGKLWCIAEGSEAVISNKIKHLILRFNRDELDLPPLHHVERRFKLSPKVQAMYDELKREFIIEIKNKGIVAAISGGAASMKLRQIVSGSVYSGIEKDIIHIHDEKIEELQELVDELQGEPLLVGYEFKHEIARLLERFPTARHLGSGVSYKVGKVIEGQWNRGEIALLFGNPASIGHGLNMQGHGCHIAIFTGTWNWENHTQFIQRVWRSGQKRPVTVHHIIATGTLDEVVAKAMSRKESSQAELLKLLQQDLIK